MKQHSLSLTDEDLVGQLTAKKGSALWLGRFTADEIENILERIDIFPVLREKGLSDFLIEIEPLEDFGQTLKVYSQEKSPTSQLAEARLHEITFRPKEKMPETFSLKNPKVLAIDWLMMQNPQATFLPDRPRLPGQIYPGLGVARKVLKLLYTYCRWQGLAALVNFPEYFHNAFLYRAYFNFYNPERDAFLTSLYRDLQPLTLAQMSWAIEWKCVRKKDSNEVFDWFSGVQIMPIQQEIKEYFLSKWYIQKSKQNSVQKQVILDKEKFRSKWKTNF